MLRLPPIRQKDQLRLQSVPRLSNVMLTKAQENVLDALLKSKRQELVDLIRSLKAVTGTKHDCEMLDVADSASLNEMRRRAAMLIHQHQSTLVEVDSALKRIRDGRYGVWKLIRLLSDPATSPLPDQKPF